MIRNYLRCSDKYKKGIWRICINVYKYRILTPPVGYYRQLLHGNLPFALYLRDMIPDPGHLTRDFSGPTYGHLGRKKESASCQNSEETLSINTISMA
jgi:hypothetical protein